MLNAKATFSRGNNSKLYHLGGETKLYLYIILPYCVVIPKQSPFYRLNIYSVY